MPEIRKVSHKRHIKIITYKKFDIGYVERRRNIISIAIHPKYQGLGFGAEALKRFCKEGDEAEILWGNSTSEKAFMHAGFRPYATRFIKT